MKKLNQFENLTYKNKELYTTLELDYDFSYYRKLKKEVLYVQNNTLLNIMYKWYEAYIKNQNKTFYFIKGYYLCFTYNNKKYIMILSPESTKIEKENILKLIYRLRKMKCSKFYLKEGEID